MAPSRHPMGTFFTITIALFLTTTATSATLAATGGETTGREAIVILAVGAACLAGIGLAGWWTGRALDRQSRDFLRRLGMSIDEEKR
jgi:hypothetical protein